MGNVSIPIACADGFFRGRYPLGTAPAPTANPAAGTYPAAQSVSLNSSIPNAVLYYTVDGSMPTFPITGTTQVYGGAIPVSSATPTEINFIAVHEKYQPSAVVSASYVISAQQTATPQFSPATGGYFGQLSVTISCATGGAAIYYTLDGSTPTTASARYTVPITITANTTIRAIALATGQTQSNVGSAAYTISTVSSSYIKWHSGPGMLSNGINSVGAGGNQTEMTALAANGFSAPSNPVKRYTARYTWDLLEPTQGTLAHSSTLDIDFVNFQNTCNGGRFGIYVNLFQQPAAGAYNLSPAGVQANNPTLIGGIPTWILSCGGSLTVGGTTYTVDPGPNPAYYGYMADSYNGTTYNTFWGAIWNPGYVAAIAQFLALLANAIVPTCTINGTVYAGYTWNTHPFVEFVGMNDEWSMNMYGPLNPPSSSASGYIPNTTNIRAGLIAICQAFVTNFTQTRRRICYSFGIAGSDSGVGEQTWASFLADLQTMSSMGMTMCNSDTISSPITFPGLTYSAAAGITGTQTTFTANAPYAHQLFVGNRWSVMANDVFGAGSPVINAGGPTAAPSLRGTMDAAAQVQGPDFQIGQSSPYSPQAAINCWMAGQIFGASQTDYCYGDESTVNPWSSYIAAVASNALYTHQTLMATNVMAPAQNVWAQPTGPTTATVNWLGDTNADNASHGWTVYINGAAQPGGPTTASANSFNVTGLTAGAAYSIQVGMSNANGPGPLSAAYPYRAPTFFYPNFAAANGSQSAIQTVSNSASFVGNVLQLNPGGAHAAGAANYKTQINVNSWKTQFTFQISGPLVWPQNPSFTAGMSFFLQNTNTTTNPNNPGSQSGAFASGDANLDCYGCYSNQVVGGSGTNTGIRNSVGIKFDLNPNNYSGEVCYPLGTTPPNQVGCYVNGGPVGGLVASNDLNPYGVNLFLGHLMQATVWYDGVYITLVLLDTVNSAQARFIWGPIQISTYIDAVASPTTNLAWPGMGGGTVGTASPSEQVTSWNFTQSVGNVLAAPTLSPAAGQYSGTQAVSLSGPPGATLWYTTNGLLPTAGGAGSIQWTGTPISVSSSQVLRCVAIQPGYTDSYVTTANYQIATANLINRPSGFGAGDGMILCGYAYRNGTQIQLTDNTGGPPLGVGNNAGNFQVSSAWFAAPVPITSFSTILTLKLGNLQVSAGGLGMMVVIQNQPTNTPATQASPISGGPFALGADSTALGYGSATSTLTTGAIGGIQTSVGISFNLTNNGVGLYTNGAMPTGSDTTVTGVTFSNGNPKTAQLDYNNTNSPGNNLKLTITDTVTLATFSKSWAINIPATVDPNSVFGGTAYIGFTASSGFSSANQLIQNWTFN